jgi:hypothetical protein
MDIPKIALEILKIVYISDKPISSTEISNKLHDRGIYIDPRTVRYHLKHLENLNLTKKIGKKGSIITPHGLRQIKRLMVYERLGSLSSEVEKFIRNSTFDPVSGKGTLLANIASLPKENQERAYELLEEVLYCNIVPSPLLAVADEGGMLGEYEVPEGHIGFACISATTYEAVLRKKGVNVESFAAGVYQIEDSKPIGFVELITHTGITLSPGELLIKAGYTSINEVIKTGSGFVTAAIKRFPSVFFDIVDEVIELMKERKIDGIIEITSRTPEAEKIDASDGNKGRLTVYGGANYFAPLIEEGLGAQLIVNGTLIDIDSLKDPNVVLS